MTITATIKGEDLAKLERLGDKLPKIVEDAKWLAATNARRHVVDQWSSFTLSAPLGKSHTALSAIRWLLEPAKPMGGVYNAKHGRQGDSVVVIGPDRSDPSAVYVGYLSNFDKFSKWQDGIAGRTIPLKSQWGIHRKLQRTGNAPTKPPKRIRSQKEKEAIKRYFEAHPDKVKMYEKPILDPRVPTTFSAPPRPSILPIAGRVFEEYPQHVQRIVQKGIDRVLK